MEARFGRLAANPPRHATSPCRPIWSPSHSSQPSAPSPISWSVSSNLAWGQPY